MSTPQQGLPLTPYRTPGLDNIVVPKIYSFNRAPTSADFRNFNVRDFWLDYSNQDLYFCGNKTASSANWILLASGTTNTETLSDTANTPVFPTAPSGTPPNNIQLTNLDGSMSIVSDSANNRIIFTSNNSGQNWQVVTTDQTASDSTGYFTNAAGNVNITLPATSAVGDTFEVCQMSSTGSWTILQNAGQQIRMEFLTTTVGVTGSISSTDQGSWIILTCDDATLGAERWFASMKQGIARFDSGRQIGPQGNGIVSNYLVGLDASEGYFTSIQDAINAAAADGATTANPRSVYIKEGTFVEDITLAAGVDLVSATVCIIEGTVTLNLATATDLVNFDGITIQPPVGAPALVIQQGTLQTYDTQIYPNAAVAIAFETAGTKSVTMYRTQIADLSGTTGSSWYTHDGANATITYTIEECTVRLPTAATVVSGAAGTINSRWRYSAVAASFEVSIPTFSHVGTYTDMNQGATGPFFEIQAGTTGGQISSWFCRFANNFGSTDPFMQFDVAIAYESYGCIFPATGGTFYPIAFASGQSIGANSLLTYENQVFSSERTGYEGADEIKAQYYAQTTDATVTTLASVVVNELESVTFWGTVIGAQSNHTNAIGGDYLITARRASGGNVTLVGAPVLNINSSSAATFTCDVDVATQSVRLRIVGIAATTYNWSTVNYYTKMLTNS